MVEAEFLSEIVIELTPATLPVTFAIAQLNSWPSRVLARVLSFLIGV